MADIDTLLKSRLEQEGIPQSLDDILSGRLIAEGFAVEKSPIPAPPSQKALRRGVREKLGVELPPQIERLNDLFDAPGNELITKSAAAGVLFDKAAPSGHFLASLAFNDDERLNAYRVALKEKFGKDVKVRLGPDTGAIEFLDKDTNRFSLARPPGAIGASIEGLGGFGMVLVPEAAGGIGGAFAGAGPLTATLGAGAGAFIGEVMRLQLGREMGINKSMSDLQLIGEAAKEGGISVAGGVIGEKVIRIGKFLINARSGAPLTASILNDVDLSVDEAAVLVDAINDRIGEAKFRLNLAQATNDEDLLVWQERFRRDPKFSKDFGLFEQEQQDALEAFFETINKPFRSRATTPEAGRAVQDVAQAGIERQTARRNIFVDMKRAELDSVVTSIRDRPLESLGRPLRELGDAEQQGFRDWAKAAATALNEVAGNKEIIKNRETALVVANIDKRVQDALFPSIQKPQRALLGERVVGEEEVPEGIRILRETISGESEAPTVEVLNRIFDPNANFTFSQAWDAISALKRVERVASKGLSTDAPEVGAVRRLYTALEKDLRASMDGSPLREQYDQFIQRYAAEKTRLDKGVVGKMMTRDGGKNGRFIIADEAVFRSFFTPGTNREAKELFALVRNNPEQMQGVRETIGDFYKRQVLDNGRVNLTRHRAFMERYLRPASVFFNKKELNQFAKPGQIEKALKARELARTNALTGINKTFGAEIANLNNPGKVLNLILDPKNADKARQMVDLLKDTPDVLRGVRNEFRKHMAERIAGQFKSGDRVFSAANFDTFLNGKAGEGGFRQVARNLFGDAYVGDLDLLNNALKRVSLEARFPNRSGTAFWADTLKNLTRAYVGLFTRPGRFLTAADRIRGRAANRVLYKAMTDPESLAELTALRGVDMRTKKAAAVISALSGSALLEDF